MNADLIRILANAYSVANDESVKEKVCCLILDEASRAMGDHEDKMVQNRRNYW